NIRHSSRALGVRSDSSARFEKGIDSYTTPMGLSRALHLAEKLGAGTVVGGRILCGLGVEKQKVIKFPQIRIKQLLGLEIPQETIINILNSLSFDVEFSGKNLICKVPLYRDDVERDCDIVEEIIRVYGYDNIQGTLMPESHITNGGKNNCEKVFDCIKNVLCGLRYNETVFYPFGGKQLFDKMSLSGNCSVSDNIRLLNPIGDELSLMNLSLLPNIIQCAAFNQNQKNREVQLFECGKVYLPSELPPKSLPTEERRLAVLRDCGDFDDIRNDVLTVVKLFSDKIKSVRSSKEFLHPGISADIYVGSEQVGYMGKLHPIVARNFGLDDGVFVAELSVDKLMQNCEERFAFVKIAKFPAVERDFALVVDESVASQSILDAFRQYCPFCIEANLFDVYRSESIGSGKKSIAISVLFRHPEKTLSDVDVEKQISKCLIRLEIEFGAVLRK
ncbi:MAG: phenylalanine--tRNA ligase subunit beta, partial [Corallococcus sp.]|nr:phenylalanine--tRNA ligase subunit beta [Corallococcus sp.]